MDTKRKIEESLAILNSIIANPNKKQSTEQQTKSSTNSLPGSAAINSPTAGSVPKKRVYLPPRPAVLDKLSRLASSRPTLKDSIAASIAASAPTANQGSSGLTTPASASNTLSTSSKNKYMPWSREQFHERLETFKPSTWFDKPKVVGPVECAKRGWINKGNDRLECYGGCGGVVIVRVDQDKSIPEIRQDQGSTENIDADVSSDDIDASDVFSDFGIEALGPKFHAMLTDNHESTCPWRVHPCDENIYKFPVVSLSQARADLLERVKFLEAIDSDCLIEKIRHPLQQDQVLSLESVFPVVTNTKLLILSLFGWSTPENQKMLFCKACHTRCTYIPSSGSNRFSMPNAIEMDEGDAVEEEDDVAFDVVQSHKWYCYWVYAGLDSSQKEGWRTLFERVTSTSGNKPKEANEPTEIQKGSSISKIGPSEALAQVRRILRGQVAPSPVSLSFIPSK